MKTLLEKIKHNEFRSNGEIENKWNLYKRTRKKNQKN
jgi:hypothetical protein